MSEKNDYNESDESDDEMNFSKKELNKCTKKELIDIIRELKNKNIKLNKENTKLNEKLEGYKEAYNELLSEKEDKLVSYKSILLKISCLMNQFNIDDGMKRLDKLTKIKK